MRAGAVAFHMPRPVLWLCGLAIILSLTLSAPVLLALGVHYSAQGGRLLFKIHPASWVILAAFALYAVRRLADRRALMDWARDSFWPIAAVSSVVAVFLYQVASDGLSGSAPLIDTYLIPSLLLLMLVDAPPDYRRKLASLIVVLLVMNALVGIGEAALQERLFKLTIKGKLVQEDVFRASAFNGHPLRNALLTSCALIALVTLRWPLPVRLGCALILGFGMLSFGGRAAIAIGVAGALLLTLSRLKDYARRSGAALGFVTWAALIFGSVTIASAAAVLSQTQFGVRIADGAVADASVMTRANVLDVFDHVHFDDLLAGYAPNEITQIIAASHLPDIECFWIYNLLYLGLLGFLFWLIGFLGELQFIWRRIDSGGRTIIVCMLLIASTSVSLTAKETLLNVVFALVLGTGIERARPVLPRAARPVLARAARPVLARAAGPVLARAAGPAPP